jgi:hypothetical protein
LALANALRKIFSFNDLAARGSNGGAFIKTMAIHWRERSPERALILWRLGAENNLHLGAIVMEDYGEIDKFFYRFRVAWASGKFSLSSDDSSSSDSDKINAIRSESNF